jgi:tRNA modification GTPase
VALRAWLEASVDFPDDAVDSLSDERIRHDLDAAIAALQAVTTNAQQGQLLRDGITLVIAGRPNAGKSSLLNALAGHEAAIVTAVPGTTRDLVRERIQIDGLPLHIIDTAGLRAVADAVEREGILRARRQIESADRVLWVFDDRDDPEHDALDRASLPPGVPVTLVRNKVDLTGSAPGMRPTPEGPEVALSARTGAGLDALRAHLKESVGYRGPAEGEFLARRRHLDALARAEGHLVQARGLARPAPPVELIAEELRLAHNALAEITGEFVTEDLLAVIFGRFCIGK